MSFKRGHMEHVRQDPTSQKRKREESEQVLQCIVCLNLDRQLWKDKKGRHSLLYSKGKGAAKAGCQICRCICVVLEHYFTFDKVKEGQLEDIIDVDFDPGGSVFLKRWGSNWETIMVYAPQVGLKSTWFYKHCGIILSFY